MYIFLPSREITLQKQVMFLRHEEISSRSLKIPKVHKLFSFSRTRFSKVEYLLSLCYSVTQSKFLLSALSPYREIDVSCYKIMVKINTFRTQKIKNLKIKGSYWVSRAVNNDRTYLDSLILKNWCSKYVEKGINPEREKSQQMQRNILSVSTFFCNLFLLKTMDIVRWRNDVMAFMMSIISVI